MNYWVVNNGDDIYIEPFDIRLTYEGALVLAAQLVEEARKIDPRLPANRSIDEEDGA